MIWKKSIDIATLNNAAQGNATEHLGIEFTAISDNSMEATMPVDHRTKQPFGLLHGGASVLLAETIGSMAGNYCVPEGYYCVGLSITANHMRAVTKGFVTAMATPRHLGRTTQVWQIDIVNEAGKPVCSSQLTLAVKEGATS